MYMSNTQYTSKLLKHLGYHFTNPIVKNQIPHTRDKNRTHKYTYNIITKLLPLSLTWIWFKGLVLPNNLSRIQPLSHTLSLSNFLPSGFVLSMHKAHARRFIHLHSFFTTLLSSLFQHCFLMPIIV